VPTIEEVFPIAGTPAYTYQKRESLENDIERYAKHGRGGLLGYGPTKAGKSVLVQRLMPEALYVRGDVQTDAEPVA
jgi:sigma54-dependent transcription regulator